MAKGKTVARSDASASDLPPGLAQPAQRALASAGIKRLAQLAKMTEAEAKALHGIGPNAFVKLRAAMEAKGLAFATAKKTTG